jgi:hypothetical protein
MPPAEQGDLVRVLADIERVHRASFALHERCSGGVQGGAWLLIDASGRRAILKFLRQPRGSRFAHVARLVDGIRKAGYPTPAWMLTGETPDGIAYYVQEHVPGEPAARPSAEAVEQMIEILERQAGLGPDPDRNWSTVVSAWVQNDETGTRSFLSEIGPTGRALLQRYDHLLSGSRPFTCPAEIWCTGTSTPATSSCMRVG